MTPFLICNPLFENIDKKCNSLRNNSLKDLLINYIDKAF